MITRIKTPDEIKELPFGAAVYYKQRELLGFPDESFDVGIVIPRNVPLEIQSSLEQALAYAADEARKPLQRPNHKNGNNRAFYLAMPLESMVINLNGMPKDKTLVATVSPFMDERLVKRFALEITLKLDYNLFIPQ